MRARLVLGPAGSGKTFRCLTEIRRALVGRPEGAPLLLLAPKQATYELERQLVSDPSLPGYTRLHVLSFERLAHSIFAWLGQPPPQMLNEEGRLMVLRGLLAHKRDRLKLFRASARLTGFAQQLSLVLRELQRHQQTPESLLELAAKVHAVPSLAYKLQDLATLLQDYLDWLKARQLQDADCLLTAATKALEGRREETGEGRGAEQTLNATPQVLSAESHIISISPDRREGEPPTLKVQRSKSKVQRLAGQLELSFGGVAVVSSQSSIGTTTNDGTGTKGPRAIDKGPLATEPSPFFSLPSTFLIEGLWVDGFAEWSPQEMELLAALLPYCKEAALTFCLDRIPVEKITWLTTWAVARNTFEQCRARLAGMPSVETSIVMLERKEDQTRFAGSPVLQHLERHWAESGARPSLGGATCAEPNVSNLAMPTTAQTAAPEDGRAVEPGRALRVAECADPEAEATLAAREILRHVRAGGRFRDAAVLVRKLEGYHDVLQRVFARYEIPFFLDRRESVSHHPLAELTRSALRTVATDWARDDWFAALKTGLVPAEEKEIDRLENEALARGWKGAAWQKPITVKNEPVLTLWLADLHQRIVPPFQSLALTLASVRNQPTGPQLAEALQHFWEKLQVETRLRQWAEADRVDSEYPLPNSVHATVWQQMNGWLANVELAFPNVALRLREWLPILEAGLAGLTVGVIPPALDQVLIGAVDRSRIPDVKLALVLGLNETVFPAQPNRTALLTDLDRAELERRNVVLSGNARAQLSRERFYAYVAFTRARQRLVLTSSAQDADGVPLNPSPFLAQLTKLFPSLEIDRAHETADWRQSEHASELIGPLLKAKREEVRGENVFDTSALASLPGLTAIVEQLGQFATAGTEDTLSPALAELLYGASLRTSVSRIEQFAACPFRFFVHSGLRAEERQLFELDVKEQGSFQHDALALFHEQLRKEGKKWRDLTPDEARQRIGQIAKGLLASYREGLLQASEESRFTARVLSQSLQDFIETQVHWLREQYRFDPVAVELPFGQDAGFPPWELDLGEGHRLALQGRIDRVDLSGPPGNQAAWCVVVDYKSSQKKLDPLLMSNGLQLQLPAYLEVLRHWPEPRLVFGAGPLVPAGVFYVNLRGRYYSESNRRLALADPENARKMAYRHAGRFDQRALVKLDARPNATVGDQFNYRRNQDGTIRSGNPEAMTTKQFIAMLDSVAANLKRMGRDIYAGVASVAPYRKGTTTACDHCGYRSICRIDPWTHSFRLLRMDS